MRAVDRATAAYLALSALALLGPGRPPLWPLLLAAHLAAAAVLLAAGRREGDGRDGWLRSWYPLLLLPAFYLELPLLNQALAAGYRDAALLPFEAALFGPDAPRALAAAFPSRAASELFHLAYLSYYPLIYGPLLLLARQGRRDTFERTLLAVMAAYYLCYLVYLVAPVQGPWFLVPPPDPVPPGPAARGARWLLEVGASRGTAFPSSHLAVAVVQTLLAVRFLPRWAPAMGLASAGIALGAVYAGIHYAIDMLAGALLAPVVVGVTARIRAACPPRPRTPCAARRTVSSS